MPDKICDKVNWIQSTGGSWEPPYIMLNNAHAMDYLQQFSSWCQEGGAYHQACDLATGDKATAYLEFWSQIRSVSATGLNCLGDDGNGTSIQSYIGQLDTKVDEFETANSTLSTDFAAVDPMFEPVYYAGEPPNDCHCSDVPSPIYDADYHNIKAQLATTSNSLNTYNTKLASANSAAYNLIASEVGTFNVYCQHWRDDWLTPINSANTALNSIISTCDYHTGNYHYPQLSQACKNQWAALKVDCLAFRDDLGDYSYLVTQKYNYVTGSATVETVNVTVVYGTYLVATMRDLCEAHSEFDDFDEGAILWCVEYRLAGLQATKIACEQCT